MRGGGVGRKEKRGERVRKIEREGMCGFPEKPKQCPLLLGVLYMITKIQTADAQNTSEEDVTSHL